ncbi:hypothetical protein ES703_76780 [subsurface metagenome]
MVSFMRHVQIKVSPKEYKNLDKARGRLTWREFVLTLVKKKKK